MRLRFLGHSCVEVVGRHHILIDPDFTRSPAPGVEFVCVTHAHRDHIGRVAEVAFAQILASPEVCAIVEQMGVPRHRLWPSRPGEVVGNIRVLPGFSQVGGLLYTTMKLLFQGALPDPGGSPLPFLIEDELTVLHIGDAYRAPLDVQPGVLCLPWRRMPRGAARYEEAMIALVEQLRPRYVLPVHHDIPPLDADPCALVGRTQAEVLCGGRWYELVGGRLVAGTQVSQESLV